MIPAASAQSPYLYLAPPYRRVLELEDPSQIPFSDPPQGEALVWNLAAGRWGEGFRMAKDRPGGLPLIIVLPRAAELDEAQDLLGIVEQCRPQSILPQHPRPAAEDLVGVLRRQVVVDPVAADAEPLRDLRRLYTLLGEELDLHSTLP